MAATKCPKCGGSGQMWVPYGNLFGTLDASSIPSGLNNSGYRTSCDACAGIGVIRDTAPVIHVHVHVHQSDTVGDLKEALQKQIVEALAESDL